MNPAVKALRLYFYIESKADIFEMVIKSYDHGSKFCILNVEFYSIASLNTAHDNFSVLKR